jgi:hypothetical protein
VIKTSWLALVRALEIALGAGAEVAGGGGRGRHTHHERGTSTSTSISKWDLRGAVTTFFWFWACGRARRAEEGAPLRIEWPENALSFVGDATRVWVLPCVLFAALALAIQSERERERNWSGLDGGGGGGSRWRGGRRWVRTSGVAGCTAGLVGRVSSAALGVQE